MSARSFSRINLLPKDAFEFSALGKFLGWALTSGRVLVVLTEFVVILAFGSRFYFDKRLNDLTEVIDQKQAVVESFSEIEIRIRDILARQKVVNDYLKQNLDLEGLVSQLKKITPPDVLFSQVTINEVGINVAGTAGTEAGLNQLVAGIGSMENVTEVVIGAIDFDQRLGLINFRVRADIKKGEGT